MINLRKFHPYEAAKRASRNFKHFGCQLLMLLIGFGFANAATAAGQHIYTTERVATEALALQACQSFAVSLGYPANYCLINGNTGTGLYTYTAGWFRADGPQGTSTDPDFYLKAFFYCQPNERYFPAEARCYVVVPENPPDLLRSNGPQCCQPSVGQPINPGTGNMWHIESDYAAADPSKLAIERTYNSNSSSPFAGRTKGFGSSWSHQYEVAVFRDSHMTPNVRYRHCVRRIDGNLLICDVDPYSNGPIPDTVAVSRGDGKILSYNRAWTGYWESHSDNSDRLSVVLNADNTAVLGWKLETAQQQTVEQFDANGRLLSITDRTGRRQVLTYSDGTTNDTSVARYPSDAPACGTVPVSASLAEGRSLCVTDDWGRQLQFDYDVKNRISKILDPAGGAYLYAYDGITGGCTTGVGTNAVPCNASNLTSVTFPDGKIKQYHYGETARINEGVNCPATVSTGTGYVTMPSVLTGLTDENGARHARWMYDCQSRATGSELAGGVERVALVFNAEDAAGKSSTSVVRYYGSMAGPQFEVLQYRYQDVLGVKKSAGVDTPCLGCGSFKTRVYDAGGNNAVGTDFNGVQTKYVYDLARNLQTSRVEAFGTAQVRTISTAWHPTLRQPLSIAEPKRITRFAYDEAGNTLTRTIQATSDLNGGAGAAAPLIGTPRTWTYTYNRFGQMLTATGPRTDVADVTTYTYDVASGGLATVTNALHQVTTFGDYDAHGRPGYITAADGKTTRLSYTERGLLRSQTVTAGTLSETTTFDYDGAELLKQVTQPDGVLVMMTYDNAHRLVQVRDSLDNTVNYELDVLGNRIGERAKDPNGLLARQLTRLFDGRDNMIKVTGGTQ